MIASVFQLRLKTFILQEGIFITQLEPECDLSTLSSNTQIGQLHSQLCKAFPLISSFSCIKSGFGVNDHLPEFL